MAIQPQKHPDPGDTADYLSFDDLVGRFFEKEPTTRTHAEIAAKTHPGLVREVNEDHYLVVRRRREREVILTSLPVELLPQVEQEAYSLAVADGMGGHAFGELASFLALRTGWELGGGEVKWPVKMNERESKELRDKAVVFFSLIDRTLHVAAQEQPRLTGMGTTLTVCYVTGPDLFVIHAGDSRAYLCRQSNLTRLTRDHTLAQTMIDAGYIQPDSPESHHARHILTNCLGGPHHTVDVDVQRHQLVSGDRVLLCTDGLTDHLEDPDILGVLEQHPDNADACKALVDLALERGGKDNVTVVLARFSYPGPAAEFPTD
jgi:protein phosphatase